MRLAWNAIVKNEAAVIERAVNSLMPHISCGIVVDTGSDDGTPEILRELFRAAGKALEIHQRPFVNFEQARNAALNLARNSRLDWKYLLLSDADMEFRVKQEPWFFPNGGRAYDLKQTAGALGYYNRRLVRRDADGWYVGVTHEYLDVASDGVLDTAEFIDHADGANRPDKFSRDIALLEKALETETRPGLIERYHFYLAGSYFDAGAFAQAATHYRTRVTLGGFEEERWYAQMRLALCYKAIGNTAAFVAEMITAYQMRPQRSEPLYELARYYREKGDNYASLLFSSQGMQVTRPNDLLFVNDWVYKSGMAEEFAISAYYNEPKRPLGATIADKLALAGSHQARANLYWYVRPLGEMVPSFTPERLAFTPPDDYVAMNPSVIHVIGASEYLVRTVNYTINSEGGYDFPEEDSAIRTRNFLWRAGIAPTEIKMPIDRPGTAYPFVLGFEDSRLFDWNDELWTISTVREWTSEGWCDQVLASINGGRYDNWKVIRPRERRHEKNWMPWVHQGELRFVYRLGTLIDLNGDVITETDPGFDVSTISGGSQVVELDEETFIALVHEAALIPGRPNRYYRHRFVSLRVDGSVDRISPPFVFHDRQIEFAAGLAYFPRENKLIASYGVRDCEAWSATLDPDEVLKFIYGDGS